MKGQPDFPDGQPRAWRDYAFVAALLVLAAVPLVGLRTSSIIYAPGFAPAIWLAVACLFAAWVLPDRRGTSSTARAPCGWGWWARAAAFVAALAAAAVVVYYLPMREHFWGGYDEVLCLRSAERALWHSSWDKLGRPTWGIAPMLGALLTPDRVEGFVWLGVALSLLNALLLAGIVRRALPGEPAIAAAAGVLLLCHRGDLSRFFGMWAANWYLTSLAFLLLGTWLLLESARAGNRGGLVGACLALGISLLGSEAGYPLAALVPGLLWLSGVRGPRFRVWAVAWTGTVGVLAVRFLLYLLTKQHSYQAYQTAGLSLNSEVLLRHVTALTEPFLTWFGGFTAVDAYRRAATFAALVAAVAVLAGGRAAGGGARRYAIGAVVAAAAAIAGLVAFLPIPNAFRTQFYTAPGQAALIAVVLGAACRLLGRRGGPVALAACVAVLAGAAAAENRQFQQAADKSWNFTRTVRVLRQLEAAPALRRAHTLVVLVEEDGSCSVGANYTLHSLAEFLGYDLIQAHRADVIGLSTKFEDTEVVIYGTKEIASTDRSKAGAIARYTYDRVVVYRLAPDGTVSLIRRLQDEPLLGTGASPRYDPIQLLRPGPVRDLPYFRYPGWVKPPKDVIDAEEGLMLGEGWSVMEAAGGRVFRRVGPGGELVINSLGQSSRTVRLEVEPVRMPAGGTCSLEVRSLEGKVLCRTALRGRECVNLTIPVDPARVSVVTLWAGPEGHANSAKSAVELRVFAPPGARLLPSTPGKPDITGVGVRLGRNWYPLENYTGEGYRWMATGGAEVVLGHPGPTRDLVVEVSAGPGLGGRPGRLRAIGPDGRVLHKESFFERKRIHIPIPLDLPRSAIVKLEIIGGGLPVSPTDPRILDALVYHCEWATETAPTAPCAASPDGRRESTGE